MHVKFSVITPHYNDFERLERLIDSVPHERADIQMIVIDDCSSDQARIKHLKEKYPSILWLSTDKNSGAGRARNIGMDSAIGEFLLFADSDDEFVENSFDILCQIAKDKIGDLCYLLAEARQEGNLMPSNRAATYNQLCVDYLKKKKASCFAMLKMRHVVPWAKIYRNDSIKSLGLRFDEVFSSNDVAFNVLAAFKLREVNVIPFYIYRVYRRPGSLTTKLSKEDLLSRLEVLASLGERLKQEGIPHRPSAISFLVRSLKHGPIFFLQVFYRIIKSDLALCNLQQLHPANIYNGVKKIILSKREQSKIN